MEHTDTTPRYDPKIAEEAIALAARLQDEQQGQQGRMSRAQVQAIADEMGIEPQFVADALAKMEAKSVPVTKPPRKRPSATKPISAGLWWATAWILTPLAVVLNAPDKIIGVFALLYVGLGIVFSILGAQRRKESQVQTTDTASTVSREALLEKLFEVQSQLEAGKVSRAFLSVDVAGSSEMKRSASELAAEHSFGQYRKWVEERVRAEGGQIHSAAGDGIMCVFDTEAQALQTANLLLADLPRFNEQQNRLSQPFRIRCGVNVGMLAAPADVPIGSWQSSVIDRAAALQKQAAPNTVVVGTGS